MTKRLETGPRFSCALGPPCLHLASNFLLVFEQKFAGFAPSIGAQPTELARLVIVAKFKFSFKSPSLSLCDSVRKIFLSFNLSSNLSSK